MSAEVTTFFDTKINYSEMNEVDQNFTIEIATNALKTQEKSEHPIYHKDIAQLIKQQLDATKGYFFKVYDIISTVILSASGTWNVIVGVSFGSFVTHETKTYIYIIVVIILFIIFE